MCTVTYLPTGNGYFLTSNRDEKSTRGNALFPKEYQENNTLLIYPKDADAGGTWIVLKPNGDSLCLLNGAFTNFIDTGKYAMSRGKIMLKIASQNDLLGAFEFIDLFNIAPFTLIIVQQLKLVECRWDGKKKYITNLDNLKPHIWSSATLYDENIQLKRKSWFNKWLEVNENFHVENIINFHKNTGDGNVENDLLMNRNGQYFTVSITSIQANSEMAQMYYFDVLKKDTILSKFNISKAFA